MLRAVVLYHCNVIHGAFVNSPAATALEQFDVAQGDARLATAIAMPVYIPPLGKICCLHPCNLYQLHRQGSWCNRIACYMRKEDASSPPEHTLPCCKCCRPLLGELQQYLRVRVLECEELLFIPLCLQQLCLTRQLLSTSWHSSITHLFNMIAQHDFAVY